MSKKIVVLCACVCGPDTSNDKAHIRYANFVKKTPTGVFDEVYQKPGMKVEQTVFLRYEGKTIDQVMQWIDIRLTARRLPAFMGGIASTEGSGHFEMQIKMDLSAEAKVHAHHLGTFEDSECYVIYIAQPENRPWFFAVTAAPLYGRQDVVYAYDIVRGGFERLYEGKDKALIPLLDFMHERIAPIMQPLLEAYDAK